MSRHFVGPPQSAAWALLADVPLDSENPDESAEILKEMIRQVGEQGLEAHLRALGRYEAFVERLNARAAESAD
jgi:hypothetical protein